MPKPVANSPFLVCFSVELLRLNHGKPKLSDSVGLLDFHTTHLRFDHLYNKNLRFSPFSDPKFQKNCFVKAKLQAATEELRITEAGRPNQPCEKLVPSTDVLFKRTQKTAGNQRSGQFITTKPPRSPQMVV